MNPERELREANDTIDDLREQLMDYKTEQDIAKGEAIALIWCIEDVHAQAVGWDVTLTHEEAKRVLALMKSKHDCSMGVSWDTVDVYIDTIIAERE